MTDKQFNILMRMLMCLFWAIVWGSKPATHERFSQAEQEFLDHLGGK